MRRPFLIAIASAGTTLASASAFDTPKDSRWVLSGVEPVTHKHETTHLEHSPLVLTDASFEKNAEEVPVAHLAGAQAIMKFAQKPRAAADNTRVTLLAFKPAVTIDPATAPFQQAINAKWEMTENLYDADFVKAHR